MVKLVDGITYMHEHTTINLASVKKNDDTDLNCFEQTVEEYKRLYDKGVRNIVDVTNVGMMRNPNYVREIAELTNINIIQSTGFYTEQYLPEFVRRESIETIAQFMMDEIQNGIDDSGIKANVIGEIGSSKNGWTDNEKKVFDAAVIAHKETGAPISTHATLGTFGLEQVDFFIKQKVDLQRIIIGHIDLNSTIDAALKILDKGAYIGFDTVGKQNYLPDSERVRMLKEIEQRGYISQVFLSMDITRKSSLSHFGGVGYSYLIDTFVPMMKDAGISDGFINNMLIHNPQTFFSGV